MKRRLVAICIATYRRPKLLRALLDSIHEQEPPEDVDVVVIVVNNDADRALDLPVAPRHPIRSVTEPVRGISAARNRALDTAPSNADFIVFVDDDERVRPGWLASLLRVQAETGAAAVQGAVVPDFEISPPDWIIRSRLHELGPYEDGAPLDFAATNNVLIDRRWLDRLGLRFDPAFGLTGGGDQELFDRLQAGGGRIVAAGSAIVDDWVPATRLRLVWLLRRQFRKGNTLTRIALLRRSGRMARFIKGLGWIGVGAGGALAAAITGRHPGAQLAQIAFGCGSVAAFAGVNMVEYSGHAVLAERAAMRGER